MRYKVSEIAELLTKKLGGNPVIKAEMLNKLLIQSGDLVETRIGKVETKTGERHGIIGQYADDFWVPYYDENAVEYVIELAAEKLGLTFPTAAIQEINGPNMYVYSRTMYNILKKTYQTPYVFLESEKDVWWTYNEAASHTAALLNYSASHNKAGQPLLPYISEEKLREACKKLENAGCSYVIFGPGKSIYSQARQTKTKGHLQVTSVSTEPVVQRYSVVTLLWYNGSNAIIEKKWLRCSKDYDPIITIDENGKKHMKQPLIDPEKEISDGSPIGKALLGHKCGDKVTVADVVYEILKIEQKEIAEEP